MNVVHTARCTCGKVEIEMRGAPIVSVVCHCDDCQAGARQIEALPGAPRILDAGAGTPYVLYRKDHVSCIKGEELLEGHKLRADSTTCRMVATCCNAAMLVRLGDMLHWTPVYRDRFVGEAPALEMRINTRFKPDTVDLPADLPSARGIPLRFAAKLIGARIAMALGR